MDINLGWASCMPVDKPCAKASSLKFTRILIFAYEFQY